MIQELTFDEVDLVDGGATTRQIVHAVAVAVEAIAAAVAAATA